MFVQQQNNNQFKTVSNHSERNICSRSHRKIAHVYFQNYSFMHFISSEGIDGDLSKRGISSSLRY